MDNTIDIKYIIDTIQQILNKVHTSEEKRKINIQLNGKNPEISFACVICGDSHKNNNLKRNHLYINNLYSKCYNEESCSRSFFSLCKTFQINIDPKKKLDLYNHIDRSYKFRPKDDYTLTLMDKLIKIDDYINFCNSGKSKLHDLKPIENGSVQYYYLKNRYINNFLNLYQAKLKITDKWTEPVVVILNRNEDSLLGLELRNLKEEKEKRIYKVMDFDYIYNQLYPENTVDELEMYKYSMVSHFINILNVEYESVVNVFEGYLDSLFFNNSIGLIGKNTRIDMLLDNDMEVRFVFDNDKDGINKSIEMIEKGYQVFLWKKLLKDLKIKKHIKDINELVIHFKNPSIYQDLNLNNYFSIDKFDKLWI